MKAIIFDRDGVILDSESININSAIKAFQKLGITIEEEEKDWIVGKHPEDYKKQFLKKYNFSYKEFRKIQRKTYHELLESVPLFNKTISWIKELHKLKIPLALTTSSGLKTTTQVLKNTNLENIFKVIITSENYKKRKPHPEPYIITAKKLNVNPKDCIVIEDSSVGVESAKKAGMKCIAIPNEYTKNQNFSKADLVINSTDTLNINLLNNL